jgi:hypothetical protein
MREGEAEVGAPYEGGCLCGTIRYRVSAPVADVAHCHCRMCRRAAGAVAVTWFTVPPDAFRLIEGQLRTWRSSAKGQRGFCPHCGCQITFCHDDWPDQLDITLATLDDADVLPAERHIWTESRLSWLSLDPQLPQSPREEGSPGEEGAAGDRA